MRATKWLLGITGGIAAYKTPELVRLLKKQGAEVRVVMSASAKSFVTPITLQAVSGQPVYTEMFDADFEAAMGHIELARWADEILIAPLSANRLAAIALGMADDLLTTLCLATSAPISVAPAMNQKMWHHPATQEHIATLKKRGVRILGPGFGEQACQEVGLGRMLEPHEIIAQLWQPPTLAENWQDLHVLITAGPTREAIDPVRFLSNRSSGKMGFALAKAAACMGATVTLISGPVSLPTPVGVKRVEVVSANEMQQAVMAHSQAADIFISAAAVADYRAEQIAPHKIKKNQQADFWQLALVANPDILTTVAKQQNRPFCVGFAAETEQLESQAAKKLIEKNIDLIAVNDVSASDTGFDVDTNALTVLSRDSQTYRISKASKESVAIELLRIISECYHAKNKTKNIGSADR